MICDWCKSKSCKAIGTWYAGHIWLCLDCKHEWPVVTAVVEKKDYDY